MRWIHLAIIIVFVAVVIIFAAQNLDSVTIIFLSSSIRAPVALVTTAVYILGAITGSSLLALIRRSVKGAQPARAPA
jgi:lipopolysaccharide assembly protein A